MLISFEFIYNLGLKNRIKNEENVKMRYFALCRVYIKSVLRFAAKNRI